MWFGQQIRIVESSKLLPVRKKALLLVSAPYARLCPGDPACQLFTPNDTQSIGNIYAFEFQRPGGKEEIFSISFIMQGASSDEKLEACDIGRPFKDKRVVLAVGADTFTSKASIPQGGRVTLYDLSSEAFSDGNVVSTKDLKPIATLVGSQALERFGSQLRFMDLGTDNVDELLITSPFHGSGHLSAKQTGLLYIYESHDFGDGFSFRPSNTHPSIIQEPYPFRGRFGASLALIRGEAVSSLIVSNPHGMDDQYDQGLIYSIGLRHDVIPLLEANFFAETS
jgi:hypothetical protein